VIRERIIVEIFCVATNPRRQPLLKSEPAKRCQDGVLAPDTLEFSNNFGSLSTLERVCIVTPSRMRNDQTCM
jgi:hypothetical protein